MNKMRNYETIILVDDNDTAIFLNKDIVSEVFPDKEILSYTNSQEFIDDFLSSREWRSERTLLLLDINMPGKFGFDILDEIEEELDGEFGELEVIMVTSSNLKRDMEVSSRFSCMIGYLTKPLTKEGLLEVLAKTRANN